MDIKAPQLLVAGAVIALSIGASVLIASIVIDASGSDASTPSGIEAVFVSVQVPAFAPAVVDAECPAGKVVTGGGAYSNAVRSTLLTLDSRPVPESPDSALRSWRVRFSNRSGTEIRAGAVAICVAAER